MKTKQIPKQFGTLQPMNDGVEFTTPFILRLIQERIQDLGILSGNVNLDLSNVNNKILTLTGDTIFTFINGTPGVLQVCFLFLTPNLHTVTWPAGMDSAQNAPDLSTDREYWLMFMSKDGFVNYRWSEWI